ncbi:MAG: hypothetical protein M3Y65_19560 [Pseudomonadota bacterium]|nr:hypothetical protein [Pseudomonadota bacterium]
MAAYAPDFILQPLAENAIKHGIAGASKGDLRVAAPCVGAQLILSVYNNGRSLPEHVVENAGVAKSASACSPCMAARSR